MEFDRKEFKDGTEGAVLRLLGLRHLVLVVEAIESMFRLLLIVGDDDDDESSWV